MKLLFGSLLLASCCALSSWSVSPGKRGVKQSPDASVMEGETVNISCCWRRDPDRVRVSWLKNETEIKKYLFNNYSQGMLQENASDCSVLTFVNITREDSGRYTCNVTVEIPMLNVSEGNGTVITVTARENTEDNTNESSTGDPVIISLAVAAPLLLLALVCFCTLKKRQAHNQAARVIYEVPHIDSEEADMDKHSTSSSRGSSQWCQVPLYESVDYFERVETKESG